MFELIVNVVRFLWKVGSPYLFERSKTHKMNTLYSSSGSPAPESIKQQRRSNTEIKTKGNMGTKHDSKQESAMQRDSESRTAPDIVKIKKKNEGVIWE